MSDTSVVTVQVVSLTLTRAPGRLIGLAAVELTLDGVGITLQGVRVMRRADGMAVVQMPAYRHSSGDLVPAVVLPDELDEVVQRQVLQELAPAAVVVPA